MPCTIQIYGVAGSSLALGERQHKLPTTFSSIKHNCNESLTIPVLIVYNIYFLSTLQCPCVKVKLEEDEDGRDR